LPVGESLLKEGATSQMSTRGWRMKEGSDRSSWYADFFLPEPCTWSLWFRFVLAAGFGMKRHGSRVEEFLFCLRGEFLKPSPPDLRVEAGRRSQRTSTCRGFLFLRTSFLVPPRDSELRLFLPFYHLLVFDCCCFSCWVDSYWYM